MNTKRDSTQIGATLHEFQEALKTNGVHGALRYLNSRTPHRFTGIYRYDGETLRNIALYDKHDPKVRSGEDAPMVATYCSLVKDAKKLEILDSEEDVRVKGKIITPVVSYCGVVMEDVNGLPLGTLCHFDMNRCQERSSDFPLMELASEILYRHLAVKFENQETDPQ